MNVIFLSPSYPPEMNEYVRGLAEVGANVIGVGDGHVGMLPSKTKHYLSYYLQAAKLFDEDALVEQVVSWAKGKNIDRVECLWEPLMIGAARIREKLGIAGMSVNTVIGFRDKSIMKDRIKAAGLRVPYACTSRAPQPSESRSCPSPRE